jgi:hypothetical protein
MQEESLNSEPNCDTLEKGLEYTILARKSVEPEETEMHINTFFLKSKY